MLYNKLLENLILPLGQKALGGDLLTPFHQYRKYQWLSRVELNQLQQQKLQKLLETAHQKSPYYQQFDYDPQVSPEENLKKLPILTKKTVNTNALQIGTNPLDKLVKIATSGSSGQQSTVYFNREELMIPRAIQLMWWEWAGYHLGDSILQTGVNTSRTWEKQLKDFFFKTRYIDAFNHSRESVKQELLLLRKKPKKFFCGFASSLYLFAKIAKEEGIEDIQFNGVISFGENLFQNYRELIEKTFRTKVYDTYGCAEGLMIASQCEFGHYHIMAPHLYLELVDDDGSQVKPGEMGRVIVTGLDNHSFPLIRYELGDLAIKPNDSACGCGRRLPVLKEIVGRSSDVIITPKGKYITVQTLTGIFKHFYDIEQFKFVKEPSGNYKLLYKPNNNFKEETLQKLQVAFDNALDEHIDIHYEKVETITPAPSGKIRIMENLCSNQYFL